MISELMKKATYDTASLSLEKCAEALCVAVEHSHSVRLAVSSGCVDLL